MIPNHVRPLIALILALSLAACGGSSEPDPEPEQDLRPPACKERPEACA